MKEKATTNDWPSHTPQNLSSIISKFRQPCRPR